ncbi:hypothetical protein DEU56DRAFT_769421 [Suillus clintonianus]|uniref:uncharacterized protein n=1 Tax=Suillus clintonianus TaxID=1904413 RepID=UPI001B85F78B|nr:uncharacterized protein DEU56DRAFT_769421 [Suillus clintonianus]KAG2154616.1 hypothetical protein DEU56DRAFT_769421 [Suillus clintonianus]
MSSQSPSQPPPFSEFEYVFDPALSALSPPPLPIPSSADLFSPSETTDLLGFLDNFNWDFEADSTFTAPYHMPQGARDMDNSGETVSPILQEQPEIPSDISNARPSSSSSATSSLPSKPDSRGASAKRKRASASSCQTGRSKVLLSTPQKRLNHIMSEQKRRNVIREGYAQLISLLAPAGAQAIDMPTRGRPKGSGSRGKGHSKGKSGVLFRAVEYCRWLEEGRDALMDEVLRLEAAAGIVYPSR